MQDRITSKPNKFLLRFHHLRRSPWTPGFFYLPFLPVQLPNITLILLSLSLLPLESYGNVVQHTQLVYPLLCSILGVASLLERARHKKNYNGNSNSEINRSKSNIGDNSNKRTIEKRFCFVFIPRRFSEKYWGGKLLCCSLRPEISNYILPGEKPDTGKWARRPVKLLKFWCQGTCDL